MPPARLRRNPKVSLIPGNQPNAVFGPTLSPANPSCSYSIIKQEYTWAVSCEFVCVHSLELYPRCKNVGGVTHFCWLIFLLMQFFFCLGVINDFQNSNCLILFFSLKGLVRIRQDLLARQSSTSNPQIQQLQINIPQLNPTAGLLQQQNQPTNHPMVRWRGQRVGGQQQVMLLMHFNWFQLIY